MRCYGFGVIVFLFFLVDSSLGYPGFQQSSSDQGSWKYYINKKAFDKLKREAAIEETAFLSRSQSTSRTCVLCEQGVNLFVALRRDGGVSKELIATIAKSVCRLLGLDGDVCDGAVDLHVDTIVHIIDQNPSLSGARFCGVYLQSSGCPQPDGYDWSVDIPEGESVPANSDLSSSEPLTIVHISDIHYEPHYVAGSLYDCSKPVCCVKESGFPDENGGTAAGVWGMVGDCDTPWVTVLNTFESIAEHFPNVDLIYYTGDTVHHQIWATSAENNTNDLRTVLQQMKEVFPNVPVFPIIGNHEPSPVNAFPPSDITDDSLSISWLYEYFAEDLENWFPASALETMRTGGYFTVKVKDNFRVVVLNSNLCIIENWWLLHQDSHIDPAAQLKWLVGVLEEAEKNNEYVHIVSHIPSSNLDCLAVWSREYRRIVERFAYTITGQFVGHTHRDDFILYFDTSNTKVINSAYNGGSVQPGHNPNFVVYKADTGNYSIIEKETWIFNLTEANQNPDQKPVWFKLYDFREAFGLADLSLESLYNFTIRLAKDNSLRQQYSSYRYKGEEVWCDDSCFKSVLCRIVRSEAADTTKCEELYDLFE